MVGISSLDHDGLVGSTLNSSDLHKHQAPDIAPTYSHSHTLIRHMSITMTLTINCYDIGCSPICKCAMASNSTQTTKDSVPSAEQNSQSSPIQSRVHFGPNTTTSPLSYHAQSTL